jgi:hypothetical protein
MSINIIGLVSIGHNHKKLAFSKNPENYLKITFVATGGAQNSLVLVGGILVSQRLKLSPEL